MQGRTDVLSAEPIEVWASPEPTVARVDRLRTRDQLRDTGHETRDVAWVQPVGCVNEPGEDVPFTRTTEFKHLTGQQHPKTILSREYPSAEGDPYYPIPRPDNRELYRKYATLAAAQRHVTFAGRLAEYKYFNMDQVVASALVTFEELARTAAVAS